MLRTPRPRSRCRRGSCPSTCAATASSGDPSPESPAPPNADPLRAPVSFPPCSAASRRVGDHAGKSKGTKVQSTGSAISTNRIRSRTFKNTNFRQSNSSVLNHQTHRSELKLYPQKNQNYYFTWVPKNQAKITMKPHNSDTTHRPYKLLRKENKGEETEQHLQRGNSNRRNWRENSNDLTSA